ncbi:hypothetical protein [Pendulispora albinea]|uniref:Uncharacterized protein n=1 Tax=Pendulispora albinea TaxID=2741071 RepID=A0ABZ2LMV0_9BACT
MRRLTFSSPFAPSASRVLSRSLLGLLAAAFALTVSERAARADLTSWLTAGGGFALERNDATGTADRAGALNFSLGVGTTPRSNIVVGGIARSVTYFSLGTDVGVAARVATGGFARGEWGLAFDAGVAFRLWKDGDHGRMPLQGVLTLGAPWGPQIAVGAQFLNLTGNASTLGAFAVFEVDLLRFTVMRKGSTDAYWFNPSPAGGRDP